MDIALALAEGKRGAIARSTEVACYIAENPAEFTLLLRLLGSSDAVVVSHASHALQTLGKCVPSLLQSYSDEIMSILKTTDQWEFIEAFSKIFSILKIGIETQSEAALRLQHLLQTNKSSIARTCALETLVMFAQENACFESEAREALIDALENGTKAMQARARKLLNIYQK